MNDKSKWGKMADRAALAARRGLTDGDGGGPHPSGGFEVVMNRIPKQEPSQRTQGLIDNEQANRNTANEFLARNAARWDRYFRKEQERREREAGQQEEERESQRKLTEDKGFEI